MRVVRARPRRGGHRHGLAPSVAATFGDPQAGARLGARIAGRAAIRREHQPSAVRRQGRVQVGEIPAQAYSASGGPPAGPPSGYEDAIVLGAGVGRDFPEVPELLSIRREGAAVHRRRVGQRRREDRRRWRCGVQRPGGARMKRGCSPPPPMRRPGSALAAGIDALAA